MVGLFEVSIGVTAGLATFFSPCAYALLPGYVGYAVHKSAERESLSTLVQRGLAAGFGVLVSLGGMVGIVGAIGSRAVTGIRILEPLVGVLIILLGILLVLDRMPSLHLQLPARRTSTAGFALFGMGYALAAVGCTLPAFLGVVGIGISGSVGETGTIFGTYVGSVVVLMVAITILAGLGADLSMDRFGMSTPSLQRLAGVVLILAGLGQLVVAFTI